MSISAEIGLSGMLAAQRALEVAGQNIANAATPGYGRREVSLAANIDSATKAGVAGSGVEVLEAVRIKDSLLSARLLSQRGLLARFEVENTSLRQVEAVLREPTADGLNAALAEFFNRWQSLAGNPESANERALVLQQGDHLALMLRTMREELVRLRNDVRSDMQESLVQLNDLTEQLAESNEQILRVRSGGGSALDFLDRRDQLLNDMLDLAGGEAVFHPDGTVRVRVGGVLIIDGGGHMEFGLSGGEATNIVIAGTEPELPITVTNGRIGGLRALYERAIPEYVDRLDTMATALIREVNKIHAEGIGQGGRLTSAVGACSVSDRDGDGDAGNDMLADAGLPFEPTAGALRINVVDDSTGAATAAELSVDPESQSLADLAAAIDGVGHLTATVSDNRLMILADAGYGFDFCADQETNILAALGINTFFEGADASNIDISSEVANDPTRLAAGRSLNSGDGSNATAIAGLRQARVLEDGTRSLPDYWQITTTGIGSESSRIQRQFESQRNLVQMLEMQQESASGVSLDEEATNLLRYQQMYRSCAHYVQVSSRLMDLLMEYL